jgi:heme/copper-type cytochrome/quinol oxidase subunit 2
LGGGGAQCGEWWWVTIVIVAVVGVLSVLLCWQIIRIAVAEQHTEQRAARHRNFPGRVWGWGVRYYIILLYGTVLCECKAQAQDKMEAKIK